MTRVIRTVAVFCGSNEGRSPVFAAGAAALGNEIGRRGIGLVYGGTHMGLMGALADAALGAGGHVTGVITERLHARGHLHGRLTAHEIAAGMQARKTRMLALADACIALPGGIGTLEEFMEAWTLNQLGDIDKPVALFDIDGYFAPFLAFIDAMVARGFLPAEHRDKLIVTPHASEIVARLESYTPPVTSKWLKP